MVQSLLRRADAEGFAVPAFNYSDIWDFLAVVEAAEAEEVPLVLHGGTGIPEADIRRAIHAGISKGNIGTIIHCTYMNTVRAELSRRRENAYTLDVMKPVREAVHNEVRKWIRICMASGKAG
jgi:fructose/tagatose bisphosphate aldolase